MNKTLLHFTYKKSNYIKNLKESVLEFAWANTMINGLNTNESEPKWITNFDELKNTCPKSNLTAKLSPLIQKVEQYNIAKAQQTSVEVIFLKNIDNLASINDLLKRLK